MAIGFVCIDDHDYIINLDSSFDFNCADEFRQVYESLDTPSGLSIDFRNTSFIDSSALGMLINMQRYFGETCSEITLINCSDYIEKVLLISRMDKLFTIK